MLATLSHKHSRSISTALLAVMILSVLQLCMMSMVEGRMMQHGDHHESMMMHDDTSHHDMMHDLSDDALSSDNHDCCITGSQTALNDSDHFCPDCEDNEPGLQFSSSPDIKPLFSLLYVVVQQALNETLQTRTWQAFTEPEILSSRPEIYLAKASFLE